MEQSEDILELDGSINFSGFSGVDPSRMVVIKKIVGNYTKRLAEICRRFESISVIMKPVHKTEASEIYEIHAKCKQ